MRISATDLILLLAALSVAFSSSASCAAEPRPFDREMSLGEACAKEKKWHEAILHYKRGVQLKHDSTKSDLYRIEDDLYESMHMCPLDPDVHIAMGVYTSSPDYGSDISQSEVEFKVAISLTPGGENVEARNLLAELPERKTLKENRSQREAAGDRVVMHHTLTKLLTPRWTPPLAADDRFLCARICVTTDKSGHAEPQVTVASASGEFDAVAVKAVERAIADFPLLPWFGQQLIFAAGEGRKSVIRVYPGAVCLVGEKQAVSQTTRDSALKYVCDRWTDKRVRDYCRPENRKPACMFQGSWSIPGEAVIGGSVAGATWFLGIDQDLPTSYIVYKESRDHNYRNGRFWLLELGPPATRSSTDEDFVIYRLRDTLFSCLCNYELVHVSDIDWKTWHLKRPSADLGRLVRDDNGTVVSYTCELSDGRTLTAELDRKLSIVNIKIDGMPDRIWNNALTNAKALIDRLDDGSDQIAGLDARFVPEEQVRTRSAF